MKPRTPKLRPMEKRGELFQDADQPFNLSSQETLDGARIAALDAARELNEAIAKSNAARTQKSFLAELEREQS